MLIQELHPFVRPAEIDANSGINCITQCIMPDGGGRIKETAIKSMTRMLLSGCYFYENAAFETYPRINVVFINVSRKTSGPKLARSKLKRKQE